jgi:hypothetical protein
MPLADVPLTPIIRMANYITSSSIIKSRGLFDMDQQTIHSSNHWDKARVQGVLLKNVLVKYKSERDACHLENWIIILNILHKAN